jgi:hypothetical protein
MSDPPTAYPPPPPPNAPPPIFQGAGAPPPTIYKPGTPGYTGPTAPDFAQPWDKAPQPQEVAAPIGFLGGMAYLAYQFGGPAAVSIIAGLACIALPFAANRYFIVLPISGVISGARAIQGGRAIGGIAGITLSILGGVISLIASGLLRG